MDGTIPTQNKSRIAISKRATFLFLFGILILLADVGCKKSDQSNQKTGTNQDTGQLLDPIQSNFQQTGPDGQTIIRDLVARYAAAKTYQDKGVLYLSYRINGQRIPEPQPWSTTFERSGRLSARLFSGKVRCDRNLLSCYVFDVETANLENQQLLIPYENQLPLNQLYRDSIAKHFIAGYAELPLDETDMVSVPKLIPPTISLLTNQVRNGWLQNPTQVQRLKDQTLDGVPCYVVRSQSNGMTADIWIDKKTTTLLQMSLPLKLLAREVIVSPEITEVVLMARFHEAVLDAPVNEKEFAFEPHSGATPVRKFVPLPETMPSELIGQTADDFELTDSKGKPVKRLSFDGKVTALLWLAGQTSYPSVEKFGMLTANLPKDRFHLASVYSDSELIAPVARTPKVSPELNAAITRSNIPAYYDPQLNAGTVLGIKAVPSVIVLDGDSKIQFARTLDDENWTTDVAAALKRVAAGDDVAAEMQDDYVRYLDSYHQQLVTVSAADLMPNKSGISQVSSSNQIPRHKQSGIRLDPVKTWTNSDFKVAGNVGVLDTNSSGAAYAVFDGMRTIVQLDETGKSIRRVELPLPEGKAANLIRIGQSKKGPVFAVFATLGSKVYLFDQNWNAMMAYPSGDQEHGGVRDCRLTDLDQDGILELVVAFDDQKGVHLVDPETGKGEQIASSPMSSLVPLGEDLVVAGGGKVGMLKAGLTNAEDTELEFQRVASLGSQHLCGVGMTHTGHWNAVGFDPELERIWALSIGSQFFETQLDPLSVSRASNDANGEIIWAIADSEDVVHLVTGSGKWLADFPSSSRLHGIAVEFRNGSTNLIVSSEAGVDCWDLNLAK